MATIRAYVMDLDGVMYRGKRPIPGAREFVMHLREKGKLVRFLSNASFLSRITIARKLCSMGVECDEDEVITSGQAAAHYINARFGKCSVFVIGEQGLVDELGLQGLRVGKEGARAVLVGLDRNITYKKMADALDLLRSGAAFLACNSDATYPVEDRIMPGAGAMIGSLEYSSGRKARILGKPNPFIMRLCLRSLGLKASEVAIVGDRLETDVMMANAVGAFSILVLTGVSNRSTLRHAKGNLRPGLIVNDLWELMETL